MIIVLEVKKKKKDMGGGGGGGVWRRGVVRIERWRGLGGKFRRKG